ncbi:MAG: hypothetical protein Q9171_007493 [Xanthocarpia ochracea]
MPCLASARSQALNGDGRSFRSTDYDNVPKGPSQDRAYNETTGTKRPSRCKESMGRNPSAPAQTSILQHETIVLLKQDRIMSKLPKGKPIHHGLNRRSYLKQSYLVHKLQPFHVAGSRWTRKIAYIRIELAKLKLRHAELEMNRSHLREEEKAYDQFECKRKELARKREEIERQYSERIKEVDRQSEEVERQREHELQAMKERRAREIADLRQQQKRIPESAPVNPSPSKLSREPSSGRSGEQNQPEDERR